MKSVLVSFLVVILIGLLYWLDVFGLFARKGMLLWSMGVVVVMLIVGFFILGNPLASRAKDIKDENK